jgi:hypothetical protein
LLDRLLLAGALGLALVTVTGALRGAAPAQTLLWVSAGLLVWAVWRVWRTPPAHGHLALVDGVAMLALGLLALLLGLNQLHAWTFAFVGDEWGFYTLARTMLTRPGAFGLFELTDSNAYHAAFSSWLQAGVMAIAGIDVTGWRLSALLPVVLAVPALYYAAHWLAGRRAALLAATALGASHLLLSFTKVPYNNSQALVVMAAALALFAFAAKRESPLRWFLLGMALGSGFLLFSLARVTPLLVAPLFLLHPWPNRRTFMRALRCTGGGLLAVAAPALFDGANWQGLLKATPLQSEVAGRGVPLAQQVMQNLVLGLQSFLSSDRQTHFIVGPHLDSLTGWLLLAGLALCLRSLGNRRLAGWLAGASLCWAAVAVVQQYGFVANTRMFALLPVYALFAGIGGAALVAALPARPGVQATVTGLLLVGMVGLNLGHLAVVAWPRAPVMAETIILRELVVSQPTPMPSAAAPSPAPTLFLLEESGSRRVTGALFDLLEAYAIAPGRLKRLAPDEFLGMDGVCADAGPALVLLPPDAPWRTAVADRMAACWGAVSAPLTLTSETGHPLFLAYSRPAVAAGAAMTRTAGDFWSFPPALAATGDRRIARPGALLALPGGELVAVSQRAGDLWRFAAAGGLAQRMPLAQQEPVALALTAAGELLVAALDRAQPLAWYGADGRLVRTLAHAGAGPAPAPADLALGDDGTIYLADPAVGGVVLRNDHGDLQEVWSGGDVLRHPAALAMAAPAADAPAQGSAALWVLNEPCRAWVALDGAGQVVAGAAADETPPAALVRRVTLADGSWLVVNPAANRVEQRSAGGTLLNLWHGYARPVAVAVDEARGIWVADEDADRLVRVGQSPQPVRQAAQAAADAAGTALRVQDLPRRSRDGLPHWREDAPAGVAGTGGAAPWLLDGGLVVELGETRHDDGLALGTAAARFTLVYLQRGQEVARQLVAQLPVRLGPAWVQQVAVPAAAASGGYDAVALIPAGRGVQTLASLALAEELTGVPERLRQIYFAAWRLPAAEQTAVIAREVAALQLADGAAWQQLPLHERVLYRALPIPAVQALLAAHPPADAPLADAQGTPRLAYWGLTPDRCVAGHRPEGLYFRLHFEVIEPLAEPYALWFHLSNRETGAEFMEYDYPLPEAGVWPAGALATVAVALELPPGPYELSFGFWTPDRRRLYVNQAEDRYWIELGVLETEGR